MEKKFKGSLSLNKISNWIEDVDNSLFNGISTLVGCLMPKPSFKKEQQWGYMADNWDDKRGHTIPKGICPKVNVIDRLEFELTYYCSALHRVNHYTTRTPLNCRYELISKCWHLNANRLSFFNNRVFKNMVCWGH